MKKIFTLMVLSFGFTQIAFADVIPTQLVGTWLYNGKVVDSKSGITYATNPELVEFTQEGTVAFSMKLYRGIGDARVGVCLVTAKGTITSIKQTSPNNYLIDAMSRAIPEKTYPLAGTSMEECMKIVNHYPFNIDTEAQFPISNLNIQPFNESFGMYDKTYKKMHQAK